MGIKPLKPELYVSNYKKSLLFYSEILGFKIEYTRDNPKFAFLSYRGAHLMIQECDPSKEDEYVTGKLEYPFGRGINFQIETNNVQKLNYLLKKNNYPLRMELKDSWYKVKDVLHGSRQILVQDPDGYLLRFSQSIGKKSVT